VKGLTTAAGIWATAAVGLSCGAGLYVMAFFVTALIVVVQLLMHRFNVGNDSYSNTEIRIVLKDSPELRAVLRQKQEELGIEVQNSRISKTADGMLDLVMNARMKGHLTFEQVMAFADEHPDIKSISI